MRDSWLDLGIRLTGVAAQPVPSLRLSRHKGPHFAEVQKEECLSNEELFKAIAEQLMTGSFVTLREKRIPVRHTSSQRLRTVAFTIDGHEYQAIEQNAEKPSRWGKLAQDGHQVVQFKDAVTNKFVAVAVDGKITFYGKGRKHSD